MNIHFPVLRNWRSAVTVAVAVAVAVVLAVAVAVAVAMAVLWPWPPLLITPLGKHLAKMLPKLKKSLPVYTKRLLAPKELFRGSTKNIS